MQSPLEPVDIEADFRIGLSRIWEDSRGRQLAAIDLAIGHLRQVIAGGEPHLGEAAEAAHRLAGSLGIFGLPGAAQLAHELEARLQQPQPLELRVAHHLLVVAEDIRRAIEGHVISVD